MNFMDDVGQTLLNWASAFGTQEMVEFLCDRGADVNKGKPAIPTHHHSWVLFIFTAFFFFFFLSEDRMLFIASMEISI